MNLNIIDHNHPNHRALLLNKLSARIPVQEQGEGLNIELLIDPCMKSESYAIEVEKETCRILAGDDAGLYYGIGKLLHSSEWKEDCFIPKQTDGISAPACSFRAIYFSAHFYNWYQMASQEDLKTYLQDLLLWGYNSVIALLPVVNCHNFEEPLMKKAAQKIQSVFRCAKEYEMKTGLIVVGNQGLKSAPHSLDADMNFDLTMRGNLGRNLCPHKEGTQAYMAQIFENICKTFAETGLDYVIAWPYDEGGCGCKKCRPWGAVGYPKTVENIKKTFQKYFPGIRVIASTWAFDDPNDEGEYAGFYQKLQKELNWVDALMVDSHGDFPAYALEHPVVKPIVNFPEISMLGLFPWGGYGANPMLRHFQKIWDTSRHLIDGGLPYSEGKYEDISKVQWAGYYWSPEKHYGEILKEYISYEFAADQADMILQLMEQIEFNHFRYEEEKEPDYDLAEQTSALAKKIDEKLPLRAKKSWRWRILYIRALLDHMRFTAYRQSPWAQKENGILLLRKRAGNLLIENQEAQELMMELQAHYCCAPFNGENHHTMPPVGGMKLPGDVYNPTLTE